MSVEQNQESLFVILLLAVMEEKYKYSIENKDDGADDHFATTAIVADTLNHILFGSIAAATAEDNKVAAGSDRAVAPASRPVLPPHAWKLQQQVSKQKQEQLAALDWCTLKKELREQFGQASNHCYNANERMAFLQSIMRGPRERIDTFLVRIKMIVSIVERGRIDEGELGFRSCFPQQQPPTADGRHPTVESSTTDIWVKILLLTGLDAESRELILDGNDGIDTTDHMTADELCTSLCNSKAKEFFEIHGLSSSTLEEQAAAEARGVNKCFIISDHQPKEASSSSAYYYTELDVPDEDDRLVHNDTNLVKTEEDDTGYHQYIDIKPIGDDTQSGGGRKENHFKWFSSNIK